MFKPKVIKEVMLKAVEWQPHRRWYHADDIAISQTYIDLYRIEGQQKMIQPLLIPWRYY